MSESELEARLRSRITQATAVTGDPKQPSAEGGQDRASNGAQRPAGKPNGSRPSKPARAGSKGGESGSEGATAPPLSDRAVREWQWRLGNAARKTAADRLRAERSEADWKELVDEARASGVPFHLLIAAAAAVNVKLPD